MVKHPPALKQDVEALEARLRSEIDGVSSALRQAKAGLQAATQDEVREAEGRSASYTDSAVANATAELQASCGSVEDLNSMREEMSNFEKRVSDRLSEIMTSLQEQLHTVDTNLRSLVASEKLNISTQISGDLDVMRKALDTGIQEHAEQTKADHQALEAAMAEAKKQSEELSRGSHQSLVQKMQESLDVHTAALASLEKNSKLSNQSVSDRIDAVERGLKEQQRAAIDEMSKMWSDTGGSLEELREDVKKQLAVIDEDTNALRDAVSEVENTTTRRVTWVIKNVSKHLRPPSAHTATLHRSWFSPRFNAGGAHGLQIELQVFKQDVQGHFDVEGQEAGDCAVFLWACRGMNLSYRLSVGSKSQTLEKVFNGRVPYGTKRLCWLKDQINRHEDSLEISVDILEAVREVEHTIEPAKPESLRLDEEPPLAGSVLFQRHINNRMLSQVVEQVNIMNSRMIRRIEWRVESASLLRRCFGESDPLCSTTFSAAGVDGMQLIFYPSGYRGASDGFCSLFLFGPTGATIKGSLIAGSQKREVSHTFEQAGAFGRTNFSRYDNVVDAMEDVVLVALDIEEAHQDVFAVVKHPRPEPGELRTQVQIEGKPAEPIQSVVKMQRVPGRPGVGLEEVRQLPSLWTYEPAGDVGKRPAGFRSFTELRESLQQRSKGASVEPSTAAGRPNTSTVSRMESVPALPSAQRAQTSHADMHSLSDASLRGLSRGAGASRQKRRQRKLQDAVSGHTMPIL
mmetsp:Transcript_64464/g.153873  ORF Transcript_64464/g.153873 Transcript_64464/m.153873 type:complete len:742 (-) Transcript_64464:47-2272(-)